MADLLGLPYLTPRLTYATTIEKEVGNLAQQAHIAPNKIQLIRLYFHPYGNSEFLLPPLHKVRLVPETTL